MDFVQLPSSYRTNHLGCTLYNLVNEYQPFKIVEFGVFHGYSTVHMAQALKGLREFWRRQIVGYDLWDKYQYTHTTIDVASKNLERYLIDDVVTLRQKDFFDWIQEPEEFDMLHLDISNCGDIIELALTKLSDQIARGAIVVFEGGSRERDHYGWMLQHKRRPINPLRNKFRFEIINPLFPSMSLMRKI
jgi:predicted O-methyltransferase YrrM